MWLPINKLNYKQINKDIKMLVLYENTPFPVQSLISSIGIRPVFHSSDCMGHAKMFWLPQSEKEVPVYGDR